MRNGMNRVFTKATPPKDNLEPEQRTLSPHQLTSDFGELELPEIGPLGTIFTNEGSEG